jgi:hypothetical protein
MKSANNCVQQTQTVLASFSVSLSHIGMVLGQGSLPVVRARFGLLTHRVTNAFKQNPKF